MEFRGVHHTALSESYADLFLGCVVNRAY